MKGSAGSDAPDEAVGRLVERGVSEEDARAAVEDGRAPVLLARLALGGDETYTLAELEKRTSVPARVLQAVPRRTATAVGRHRPLGT